MDMIQAAKIREAEKKPVSKGDLATEQAISVMTLEQKPCVATPAFG